MNTEDTICAICSGVGGAISIIRIAGSNALKTARKIWRGSQDLSLHTRKMLFGYIQADKGNGDCALAVYMPGPNSYTGDDIVEVHCHGGVMAAKQTLNAIMAAGARLAEPGEFTFRAFVNNKMDLTQAEAVGDIISAHSETALCLAERQIKGSLSNKITPLYEQLNSIIAECESRMDFAEEDLDWTPSQKVVSNLDKLHAELLNILSSHKDGAILRNGIRVVIAGRPNAGKSSLLNLLLGFERAIVTQIPGTTRDTLEEMANLRGIPVKLIDTAGIREATDLVEGIGIDRSKDSIAQAQVIFWVLDASTQELQAEIDEMERLLTPSNKLIVVWNKIDLKPSNIELPPLENHLKTVEISVAEARNIDALLDCFEQTVWGHVHVEEPEFAINSRHAELLKEALKHLPESQINIDELDWELASINLNSTLRPLGNILGVTIEPDILDDIFGKFCIGK